MAYYTNSIFTEPEPSYIVQPKKVTNPVLKELFSLLECINIDIRIQSEYITQGNLTPCEYIRYSAQLAESKRYKEMVENSIKSYLNRKKPTVKKSK